MDGDGGDGACSFEYLHPWPYLDKMFQFSEQVNDSYRFKCVLCLPKTNYITAYKNSPSSLRKHITRRHNGQLMKYCELTTTASKRKTDAGASSGVKQLKLEDTRKVSQKTVDNSILRFIVQGLQAFSLVEQPSFQALVLDLQSNSIVMPRTTVCRRIDTAMMTMKARVKEAMSKIAYIATTTDCWTVRRSFIGVTAHWLDPSSFERHSVALACRRIKGPHTFDVLANAINDIHTEYEIRQKIVRTTTDNGSNFLKAFHEFGMDENSNDTEEAADEEDTDEDVGSETEVEFIDVDAIMAEDDGLQYQLPKHHRCACHLLNLVSTVDVENANSTEAYKKLSRSAFSKSQALWNKTSRSTPAAESVEKHCKFQLVQPNKTRWNSLYLAVERIVRILKDQGEGPMRELCAELKVPMYTPADMAFLSEYSTTMSQVAKAINILQGESDVQMGWLLPTITTLITKIEKMRPSLRFCKPLVDAVLGGLRKRFGSMMSDPELIAAAILNPKFKTSWTNDEDVLKLGLNYIKEHLPDHDEGLHPADSSSTSDEEDFFSNIRHTHTQETVKQLDAYLTCSTEGVTMLSAYSSVCNLSLKLNTDLPASAACERLFSAAGLIFRPKRAAISPRNFENQLLLKLNKDFYNFD